MQDEKRSPWRWSCALAGMLALLVAPRVLAGPPVPAPSGSRYYLPQGDAARTLTVTPPGSAAGSQIVVSTIGLATKESGPRQTVARFGELYAFEPSFFVAVVGVPVRISFWNLQPDDDHDLMILDPRWRVLLHLLLPPLSRTTYDYTFHAPGLYPFVCTMHSPEMAGQILVVPASVAAP